MKTFNSTPTLKAIKNRIAVLVAMIVTVSIIPPIPAHAASNESSTTYLAEGSFYYLYNNLNVIVTDDGNEWLIADWYVPNGNDVTVSIDTCGTATVDDDIVIDIVDNETHNNLYGIDVPCDPDWVEGFQWQMGDIQYTIDRIEQNSSIPDLQVFMIEIYNFVEGTLKWKEVWC